MVVFKNPRDVSQIMALAHQMYPQRTKYFLEAYTTATARPHGYLVIDMTQETPDILRRYMVFSSMKQILNDVHDTDVSVVTLLRKQRSYSLIRFVHEVV
jgi:hypothetical protein